MSEVIAKLIDLRKQATTERSHFYVASCVDEAIAEIRRLEGVVYELNCRVTELRMAPIDDLKSFNDQMCVAKVVQQIGDAYYRLPVKNVFFSVDGVHIDVGPAK